MLRTILLVLLILILLGALPQWPHAATWGVGYWPSGVSLILIILVILLVA